MIVFPGQLAGGFGGGRIAHGGRDDQIAVRGDQGAGAFLLDLLSSFVIEISAKVITRQNGIMKTMGLAWARPCFPRLAIPTGQRGVGPARQF